MVTTPFDLERVRRNWDRAAGSTVVPLPARFADVPAARDPYPEARRILDRLSVLCRAEFPRQAPKLAPFLAEASTLLGQLVASAASGAGAEATADPAPLRADLQKVLDDLQDLCEVYAGIGLR